MKRLEAVDIATLGCTPLLKSLIPKMDLEALHCYLVLVSSSFERLSSFYFTSFQPSV